MSTARKFSALGLALIALSAAACREPRSTVDQTIVQYAGAVQAQDFDRLFCLSAGAAGAEELGADPAERRANFRTWAEARYETYLLGRDEGRIDLADEGILVVKAFSLGRGTFATYEPAQSPDADTRLVRSDLRFGYGQIDLSRFSPGTTLYLGSVPLGRVLPIRIPRGFREVSLTVLESVSVDWGMLRMPPADGCPGGWAVASARPLTETATTTELTWVF